MNLTELIINMREDHSPENNKAFADYFRSLTDDNSQVYTTVKRYGTGFAIDTAEHTGSNYCIMYSDASKVEKREGSSTGTIGLSNLIDCVYSNPHIAGLVINPNSDPVYMKRADLEIMSGKEDPRLKKVDWGKGIPEYKESDLLVAEEGMEFAMGVAARDGLEPGGYQILEANSGLAVFPNFVCMKEAQLYFVSVDCCLAPNVPHLDKQAVPEMLEIAAEHNAKVLYAPVSFGSADPERLQARLALYGDEFIGTLMGMLEVYQ